MKKLFLLGALLIPTIVYSANDLEKWNSELTISKDVRFLFRGSKDLNEYLMMQ